MKNIAMIACVSKDLGLGRAGQLLWRLPEDMQFFKQMTIGSVVVMGRKTFESIGNPLPGRTNVVLSHQPLAAPGINWCQDKAGLDEFLSHQGKPVFIIGGATLYEMYLPAAQKIYLTEIDDAKPADTYFPAFDKTEFGRQVLQSGNSVGIQYEIVEYMRKS